MLLCGYKIDVYKNKYDKKIGVNCYFNVTSRNYKDFFNINLKLRHDQISKYENIFSKIYSEYDLLDDNKYFELYQDINVFHFLKN